MGNARNLAKLAVDSNGDVAAASLDNVVGLPDAIDVNASAPADSLAINASGYIGVGTTSPSYKTVIKQDSAAAVAQVLQLENNAAIASGKGLKIGFGLGDNSGSTRSYIEAALDGSTKTYLAFATNDGATGTYERMRIDGSGYLYVNNMAVGGTANMHWSSSNGQFFVTSSSRRFKHDIVDYDKGLAEVMQMQPKYFVYNEEPNQKQRVGFIAEDFHDIGMTEFVEYWKDENDQDVPSEIGYSNMVAICVKAIQELKAENDALKSRLDAVEALEARIAALEAV